MVLAIRSIREDASDTYSCVARNLAGLVSAESKISVLPRGIFKRLLFEEQAICFFYVLRAKSFAIAIGSATFDQQPITT